MTETIAIAPSTPCADCLQAQGTIREEMVAVYCPHYQAGAWFTNGIWTCWSPVSGGEFGLKIGEIAHLFQAVEQDSPAFLATGSADE
jgi:hypothetical protein